jgi:hypothetical protein
MPYIINRYDGTQLTVLEDGSINTTTSIGLIGRNYFGYGEQQNENFIFLLEHFANVNPPSRPLNGQAWFDTNINLLKVYNGTTWNIVGSAILSDTEPTTPTVGSFWLKTPANILYAYNGTDWTFIGPETAEGFGVTRSESTTLLDSTNAQRPVILFKVNGKIVSIASEVAFTLNPSVVIDGFANIAAGVTVSSSLTYKGNLDGIAERARQLQTTRLINGVGFNGTADVTIKAATTNKLTPGTYILGDVFDGASPEVWRVDATPSNEGGKVVARNVNGDFSARNITANLIGNVQGNVTTTEGTSFFNICYANRFEGATLSGNATTATRLQTPRKINDVLFSGLEDITVSANAETLSGTFIKSSVVGSNLQQVGTLQNLSVQGAGINIGNTTQKLRIVNTTNAAIYSETGTLRIGTNSNPEFNFLNAAEAAARGGPAGFSTLAPTGNSNIGLPLNKIKTIYADQVEGNSATATLANSSVNLNGGAAGTVVYQTAQGVTAYLPAGVPGYVLRATAGNSVQWTPIGNQPLNRGTYLNFVNGLGNPVNLYNADALITISVDATPNSTGEKVVARDANGDFSAARITLTQTPTAANHAVTKSYVDSGKFTITSGNTVFSTSSFTNQVGSFNDSANHFDVFPPAGKSMANLVAFIPSIAIIHFAGNVNFDDSMRCTWSNLGDRVRVYVQNTEQRSTPAANYLAIWSQ